MLAISFLFDLKIQRLHSLENMIFHRLPTATCVYGCPNKSRFIPVHYVTMRKINFLLRKISFLFAWLPSKSSSNLTTSIKPSVVETEYSLQIDSSPHCKYLTNIDSKEHFPSCFVPKDADLRPRFHVQMQHMWDWLWSKAPWGSRQGVGPLPCWVFLGVCFSEKLSRVYFPALLTILWTT